MSSFYFDTSALVKRYLDETGSGWLANQTLVRAQHPPLTFVCADLRLLNIARAEGLLIENPNDHP